MSNYLTVMTAEADAARRNADLLRDLETLRRTGPQPVRQPLARRLIARVLHVRRPALAS